MKIVHQHFSSIFMGIRSCVKDPTNHFYFYHADVTAAFLSQQNCFVINCITKNSAKFRMVDVKIYSMIEMYFYKSLLISKIKKNEVNIYY